MIILFTRVVLAGLFLASASFLHADEYDTLRARWVGVLTGGSGYNPADPDISLALTDVESVVASNGTSRDPVNGTGYWDTLDTSAGRTKLWSDLTSTTNSSQITTAYRRIAAMALAYASHGSTLQGDTTLRDDIVGALDWMYANRYNSTKTKYNNHWDWEIGAPWFLHDAVALVYPHLTATQRSNFLNTSKTWTPTPLTYNGSNATGANRTWKCKVVGLRGILLKDDTEIAAARDALSPLFDAVSSGDGFYSDGSFIQHGKHPYNGGYGRNLIVDLMDLLYLLEGSTWAVTDPDRPNIFRRLYSAYEPAIYRGEFMDMLRGREFARYYSLSHLTGRNLVGAFVRAAQIAPAADAAYYKRAIKYWIQTDSTFGSDIYDSFSINDLVLAKAIVNDSAVVSRGELLGHYRFPSMDRVIHLKAGWGAGLSKHSSRIYNFESINGENLKGWNTGAGMLYLYNADQQQFSQHFWPTINPYRLPGTTIEAGVTASESDLSGTSFVGGVESHGSSTGVAAMNLSPAGRTLRGKKSWFFFDDEVVCLGAGILASGVPAVETVVENRRLNTAGSNAFLVNGSASLSSLQTAPGTPVTLTGVTRAHLSGNVSGADIGYYFPGGATLKGMRETRTGTWTSINSARPENTVNTNHYLTLWFDHGVAPSTAAYAYVLLPNYSASATTTYAGAPEITVLENSTTAQAVKETGNNTIGAVFWGNTSKTVGTGADAITSSTYAAVMTQVYNNVMYVTVSDPTQTLTTPIEIELGRSATGIVGNDAAVDVVQTSPTIKLSINVNGAKGRTRRASLQLGTITQVVVDNTDAGFTAVGAWSVSTTQPNYYGSNYAFRATGTGTNTARWTPNLPSSGTWAVYYRLPNGSTDRSTNAPFRVSFNGGTKTYPVNQQTTPGGDWIYLGSHSFNAGTGGYVELSDAANNSNVIADAIKFVK